MICDVSKHQGKIDWAKLAPELDFVVIKASGKEADPQYTRNASGAAAHGVPFHAYHFLYCRTAEAAKREAALFYNTVRSAGHEPRFWVLDCEAGWGIANSRARPVAEAFEAELRRLAGDIRVAIYIAQHKYYDYALDYDRYAYVWIPGYGEKWKPTMPHDLWQYTDKGRLPGVSGNVDLDALSGRKPLKFFTGNTKGSDDAMLNNKQLVAFCEQVFKAGWVYWYGTYGLPCTEALYKSKKAQYPSHYTAARASGYKRDITAGKWCADCVGLIKAFFWSGGKIGVKPTYASNHCPDVSADDMIKLCKEQGPIKSLPEIPGLVVWKTGHIGVYIGGGYTIEMRGFDYDCVKRKLSDGPWTKWGRLPEGMIAYEAGAVTEPEPSEPTVDGLKRGDHGSAVKAMQKLLLKWDAGCLPKYGADGDFGSETEAAVKAYQTAQGLTVTGVYDDATREALTNAGLSKHVVVTGDSVYVRTAPYVTSGRILGVVRRGCRLPYQGQDSPAGWHLVIYDKQNAWISGKYSRVE